MFAYFGIWALLFAVGWIVRKVRPASNVQPGRLALLGLLLFVAIAAGLFFMSLSGSQVDAFDQGDMIGGFIGSALIPVVVAIAVAVNERG